MEIQEKELSDQLQQVQQRNSFAAKLKKEQIGNLIERHRKTILQDFEYDLTNPNEFMPIVILSGISGITIWDVNSESLK